MKKLIDYVPPEVLEWDLSRFLVEVFNDAQLWIDEESEVIDEVANFLRATDVRILRPMMEDLGGVKALTGMPPEQLVNSLYWLAKMWNSKGSIKSVEYLARVFFGGAIVDTTNLIPDDFIILNDFTKGYLPNGYDIGRALVNEKTYQYRNPDLRPSNTEVQFYDSISRTFVRYPLSVHSQPQPATPNTCLVTTPYLFSGDFNDYVGTVEIRMIGEYFSAPEARKFAVKYLSQLIAFASLESVNFVVKFYSHVPAVSYGVWDSTVAVDFTQSVTFTQRPDISLYI